jgi:hypothetical protein
MRKISFVTYCFIIIIFAACSYHKADVAYPRATTCDTTIVRYSVEVVSILNNNCKDCHFGNSAISGINLFNWQTIHTYATDGKHTYGTLLSAVLHQGGAPKMPLRNPPVKISQCDIDKLTAWVNRGALNN